MNAAGDKLAKESFLRDMAALEKSDPATVAEKDAKEAKLKEMKKTLKAETDKLLAEQDDEKDRVKSAEELGIQGLNIKIEKDPSTKPAAETVAPEPNAEVAEQV